MDALPHLGPRLLALAEAVIPARTAADIGCDHAQLAAYLVGRGICPRVIATEVAPHLVTTARNYVAGLGLADRLELRCGSGLVPLAEGEASTVVIGGMGGRTIAQILRDAGNKVKSYDRLVLQPMTDIGELRRWLHENGFACLDERAVTEGRHLYQAMVVEPRESANGLSLELSRLLELLGWEIGPVLLWQRPAEALTLINQLEARRRELLEQTARAHSSRCLIQRRNRWQRELAALKDLREAID
ncbi:MAG: class I SAM-dependent methyltransferase [Bacillota bacterium]